jgi:hypothetical protein
MARLVRQLRYLYLAFFSKPVPDRRLYRHIRRHKSRRILELGVGTRERALRLIEVAAQAGPNRVSYTGVDLFEMRSESDGPGVSLKLAYRDLQASGARVRLVPGRANSALAQTANSLGPHDLVLIAADQPDEARPGLVLLSPHFGGWGESLSPAARRGRRPPRLENHVSR